ncbi:MAG: hypothetical protein RI924_536 [Bacteroidota bacterium]
MKLIKTLAFVLMLFAFSQSQANIFKKDPIYILEGKMISKAEMGRLSPNSIESVSILKGAKAIEKYGKKGKRGVVEITLKKAY